MSERCEAHVYRGEWSTLRRETCGKPAKGTRTMYRSEKTPRPACGIHMRSPNAMWWADLDERIARP